MSVIEKLKEAVRSVVDERAELYKEARLEDGRGGGYRSRRIFSRRIRARVER